ncbi:hypothetical protein D039_4766B, partial [Vibrio parahaemolyticus EKP-028]
PLGMGHLHRDELRFVVESPRLQ